MNDKEFDLAMKKIIYALKEKEYNPVDQINGYLIFRDSSYITMHNNARDIIETPLSFLIFFNITLHFKFNLIY